MLAWVQERKEHPRLRGEDGYRGRSMKEMEGTPPPARGRRSSMATLPANAGNTPACAGKTVEGFTLDRREREHPRLRGEDRGIANRHRLAMGTPPPARGRHFLCCGYVEDRNSTDKPRPSKSMILLSATWCILITNPLSHLAEQTITTEPSSAASTSRSHIWSATRGDSFPTYSPGSVCWRNLVT